MIITGPRAQDSFFPDRFSGRFGHLSSNRLIMDIGLLHGERWAEMELVCHTVCFCCLISCKGLTACPIYWFVTVVT